MIIFVIPCVVMYHIRLLCENTLGSDFAIQLSIFNLVFFYHSDSLKNA